MSNAIRRHLCRAALQFKSEQAEERVTASTKQLSSVWPEQSDISAFCVAPISVGSQRGRRAKTTSPLLSSKRTQRAMRPLQQSLDVINGVAENPVRVYLACNPAKIEKYGVIQSGSAQRSWRCDRSAIAPGGCVGLARKTNRQAAADLFAPPGISGIVGASYTKSLDI
jgi:hypothetical protein